MNLKEFLKLKTFFAGAKQGLSNRQLQKLTDVVILIKINQKWGEYCD